MNALQIDGKSLTLEQLQEVAHNLKATCKVRLSSQAIKFIQESRQFIESKIKNGSKEAIYGVNTGFGILSNIRIDSKKLEKLQVNLLRSHACGVGKPLSQSEVRAAILLRANTLAQGYSGVTPELIEALLALLNKGIHPWIPEQGSVGACGDLAPLAHLCLVLMGEGQAYYHGKLMPGYQALKEAGVRPYKILAKEGLSLVNGTQIMTAIGALTLLKAEALCYMADVAGAMTIEAFMGSNAPFDTDVHRIRPHQGQIEVASHMQELLQNSSIMKSHKDCNKVQDPYSLRCIPQVHGIARDVLRNAREILKVEINSVTDNPLIFAAKEKIVNAGNFHGEYIGMVMDQICCAIAELASISEQRIAKLINPNFSDLPPFLIKSSGLNSGLMMTHVCASSLVSENKILCHPATVDSIPTNIDKEDHVSMGTIAARKARSVLENAWNVIAIEFLTAAQGLEFRKPLRPAKLVEKAYQAIRSKVPPITEDRAFYMDIAKISKLMLEGKLL